MLQSRGAQLSGQLGLAEAYSKVGHMAVGFGDLGLIAVRGAATTQRSKITRQLRFCPGLWQLDVKIKLGRW